MKISDNIVEVLKMCLTLNIILC